MVIQQTVHNLEQGDVALPDTGRPVVRSNRGVISSGHYLTSMAGMKMLLAGGNAFDAMVAASLAAAVVEPIASYSLLAEGVFMLYDSASGELTSLNGQGGAPAAATPEFYRSRGHARIPTGPGLDAPLSFTQPGIVDAFIAMLERYGTLSFADVVAPAVSYAEDGIPHYEYMLERLRSPSGQEQFDNFPPGGWDVFYDDRRVPAPGALMVQPGLANTLKIMRDASLAESEQPQRQPPGRPRCLLLRPHRPTIRRIDEGGWRHLHHGRPRRLPQQVRGTRHYHLQRPPGLGAGHLDARADADAGPQYPGKL